MALIAVGNQKKATLLAQSTIGYTSTNTTGGSSYYTTTTGFTGPRFVSMASGSGSNQATYSADGITWTSTTMPSIQAWMEAVYGDGKFVAVAMYTAGYGGPTNQAAYSADGVTWTATTMPSTAYWTDITYADNKFVAVSDSGAALSADGITWTATTMPSAGYSKVTYGDLRFVATATAVPSRAAYSTDGINWTENSMGVNYINDLIWAGGKFVAVGSQGNAAYSTDGVTWTQATSLVSNIASGDQRAWDSITHGNGKFVINSANQSFPTDLSAYSTDGINWTQSAMPNVGRWTTTYGDGGDAKFLAVSVNGGSYGYTYEALSAVSTDGINWTTSPMPEGQWFNAAFAQISTSVEVQVSIGGQGEEGAEILAPVAIYTTPTLKTSKVVKVQVVNLSSPGITYDLAKLAAGDTLTEANSTILDKAVAGNSTDTLNNIFNMVATDSITVLPSTVDTVQVLVYGVEEDV